MDHARLQVEHLIYARECLAPFLTLLFNCAIAEGFRPQRTMNTVSPIHKRRDPMDPNIYRTIMIGHTLAKLYGVIVATDLSSQLETLGLRAPE